MAKKKITYKEDWKADDEVKLKAEADWTKRVGVDFPLWMIRTLDQESNRIGVARQALIKMWVSQRLDQEQQSRSA